ncbi:MAG: hypothetical protein WD270_08825 [Acetobacterales bacterium]
MPVRKRSLDLTETLRAGGIATGTALLALIGWLSADLFQVKGDAPACADREVGEQITRLVGGPMESREAVPLRLIGTVELGVEQRQAVTYARMCGAQMETPDRKVVMKGYTVRRNAEGAGYSLHLDDLAEAPGGTRN